MRDITGDVIPNQTEQTTSKFPLRMTQSERSVVERVQADAAAAGITASLNDIIRHMMRSSQVASPRTELEARSAIYRHWDECEVCDGVESPRCLDGLQIQRVWNQFVKRTA